MKAYLVPIAVLAAVVSAQTPTTAAAPAGTSVCAADYILEACLGTENGRLSNCGTNNYGCECEVYGDIMTCFNNCPNDPRVSQYQGQQEIYCAYASQYPSSTTAKTAAQTASSSGATATGAATTTASSTSTGSAASASKTNGAADLALNAGGVLAVVAGVVAAVL